MVDETTGIWSVCPMLPIIASATALFLACSFAFLCGGRDERLGAMGFAAAGVASAFPSNGYASIELTIFIADLSLATLLVWLLLSSKAYWPIWATGFHMVTLATHFGRSVQPAILPIAYATFGILWSYPVLLALAWGTSEHMHYKKRINPNII